MRQTGSRAVGRWVNWWASYQVRKIAGCACAGNAGNVFPRRRFQRKPLVSYPGMHHGTCVTHVPWCMSGSLTCGDGENVPSIPGACAPAILRIWQEANATYPRGVSLWKWSLMIYFFHVKFQQWVVNGLLYHNTKHHFVTWILIGRAISRTIFTFTWFVIHKINIEAWMYFYIWW